MLSYFKYSWCYLHAANWQISYVLALADPDIFLCTCNKIDYRYSKGRWSFEYDILAQSWANNAQMSHLQTFVSGQMEWNRL